MWWAIAVILGLAWTFTQLGPYSFGAGAHVLLVFAIGSAIYHLFKRRRDNSFAKGI